MSDTTPTRVLTDDRGNTYRVPESKLVPWHTVRINYVGWRLTHPITCDLDLCLFSERAESWVQPPAPDGSYRWWGLDDVWVEVEL